MAAADMRRIMFPVMGMVLGISWVVLGFLANMLPHTLILIVVALVDAILGIFLIFTPSTTYLGLYYIALGAFTIAIIRHGFDRTGMAIVILGTIVAFLMTGGLTFVNNQGDYFSQVDNEVNTCENDMDITDVANTYWNLDTRCENWMLFIMFSVFVLFLVQPVTLICAYFAGKNGDGGGSGGGGGGSGGGGSGGGGSGGGGSGGGGGTGGSGGGDGGTVPEGGAPVGDSPQYQT